MAEHNNHQRSANRHLEVSALSGGLCEGPQEIQVPYTEVSVLRAICTSSIIHSSSSQRPTWVLGPVRRFTWKTGPNLELEHRAQTKEPGEPVGISTPKVLSGRNNWKKMIKARETGEKEHAGNTRGGMDGGLLGPTAARKVALPGPYVSDKLTHPHPFLNTTFSYLIFGTGSFL